MKRIKNALENILNNNVFAKHLELPNGNRRLLIDMNGSRILELDYFKKNERSTIDDGNSCILLSENTQLIDLMDKVKSSKKIDNNGKKLISSIINIIDNSTKLFI